MKEITKKLAQYLTDNGVPYELIEHEPAGSADEYQKVLGTRKEEQAKAVFVKLRHGSRRDFAVVAVQAHKRVELQAVAALLGAKKASLASEEALSTTTDCGFGELPPMGRFFGVPLVFDRDLLDQKTIYFNAGDLRTSMLVEPALLADCEKAILL